MIETETVTIGKRQFEIAFSRYQAKHPRLGKRRTVTQAIIFGDDGPLAFDYAYRNPKDKPNPATGKAVALRKAASELPRNLRIRLLQAYFSDAKTAPSQYVKFVRS